MGLLGSLAHSALLAQSRPSSSSLHLAAGASYAGLQAAPAAILRDPQAKEGSLFGQCLTPLGDVNGDGYADVLISAYGAGMAASHAYVYLGSKSGLRAAPVSTLTDPVPASGNGFGASAAGVGDVNGDGYADALIGAYSTGQHQGRAYLYLGSAHGLLATPALTLSAPDAAAGDYFGSSMASVGDVNGDGYNDVLVGSKCGDGEVPRSSSPGRGYLYLGGPLGLEAQPSVVFQDPQPDSKSNFGQSVAAAGDVNGDGYADVIIGAPNMLHSQGRAYVYLGHPDRPAVTPSLVLDDPAATRFDLFGYSVAGVGDVNADGYADVLVGAHGTAHYKGKSYLYLGSAAGLTNATRLTVPGPDAREGDQFGTHGIGLGDVNHDGYADIAISSNATVDAQGKVYVFFGNKNGIDTRPDLLLDDATGTTQDLFGLSTSSVGDVNGDGGADLLVGACGAATFQGQAYLYLGQPGAAAPAQKPMASPAASTTGMLPSWSAAAYPNPFAIDLSAQLTTPEAGPVSLTLYDATGRPVLHRVLLALAGSQRLPLSLQQTLPSGVYLLLVRQGNHAGTVRLVHE